VSEATKNAIKDKLSGAAFERLLNALDPDRERAGEIYVELWGKLRDFFGRGRCRESDLGRLVDEVINRLERKLGEGEPILNINSYAHGVAKNVRQDYFRKRMPEPLGVDPPGILITENNDEADSRYECLEKCLADLNSEDRELILGYYDPQENEKNKDIRKRLAERFGISSGSLKVRATRLRDKLRMCIADCMQRSVVTNLAI
jgi:RNA polymerase sigma factor (sigma-70 family)